MPRPHRTPSTSPAASRPRHRTPGQHGGTLIEVLLSLLLVGAGLLTLLRAQTGLWQGADRARQQMEAVRLAQDELERLRSLAPGSSGWQALASQGATDLPDPAGSGAEAMSNPMRNTTFQALRSVSTPADLPALRSVQSSIRWTDRSGTAQQLDLPTLIGAIDPLLGALLRLDPGGRLVSQPGPQRRHALIPHDARDLGTGLSAFKPRADRTLTWIFDNASGEVRARCESNAGLASADLTAASLGSCRTLAGLLIAGQVRFATDDLQPDPENPASAAQDLDMDLRLDTTGASAECSSNASGGAVSWISYHCVVATDPAAGAPRWSGRLDVAPRGWQIAASGASARRVCRYSADHDGNGRIDNAEHPARHSDVTEPLAQQNFLVIRADAVCPADRNPAPLGSRLNFADDATVAHQP